MHIPIFIINLKKDTDRKIFQEEQMKKLGLPYTFIDAFYGDDQVVITECDDKLAIQEHGKVLMRGEKGCAYSHRFCYEKMQKEHIAIALILEDDVVLPDNFKDILYREIHKKKKSWDWLSFDYPTIGFAFIRAWIKASRYMIQGNKFFFLYALVKFPAIATLSLFEGFRNTLATQIKGLAGPKIFYRPLYNAGAYVITKEGIEKMKPLLYPIRFSADRTPNQARIKTGLKMRWYVPQIVRQMDDVFESNTTI